jgi:hypothetical protein
MLTTGGPPIDTETVTVNGDGTYTTPTGFTLPGMVTGTFDWTVSYSGDPNNIPVTASLESVSVGSSVPEPSTWAMMLPGFASLSLGFAFRQSRRETSFA